MRTTTPASNTSASTSARVDGRAGINTIAYDAPSSEFRWRYDGATLTVWKRSGSENFGDKAANVRRLQFSDVGYAFDVDGDLGPVVGILSATFGAAAVENPAFVGVGLRLLADGMSQESLCSVAATARLGAGYSDSAVVDLVLRNVLGRTPTPAESSSFVQLLVSGAMTPPQLVCAAARLATIKAATKLDSVRELGLAFK